jgi:repressor LexA
MRGLTERQEEILSFIAESIAQEGRFPSFREIGRAFNLNSVATVSQHLGALVDKGFLIRDGRRLMPSPKIRRDRGVPILGRVAAGKPISAIEHQEGQLNWDTLAGSGGHDTFAVRVVGDSMIDEGILEGDFAIVLPSEAARDGDLVVAYLGEEQDATVKRFYHRPAHVDLRPANQNFKPIKVDRNDPHFRLAGRVIGIVRRV